MSLLKLLFPQSTDSSDLAQLEARLQKAVATLDAGFQEKFQQFYTEQKAADLENDADLNAAKDKLQSLIEQELSNTKTSIDKIKTFVDALSALTQEHKAALTLSVEEASSALTKKIVDSGIEITTKLEELKAYITSEREFLQTELLKINNRVEILDTKADALNREIQQVEKKSALLDSKLDDSIAVVDSRIKSTADLALQVQSGLALLQEQQEANATRLRDLYESIDKNGNKIFSINTQEHTSYHTDVNISLPYIKSRFHIKSGFGLGQIWMYFFADGEVWDISKKPDFGYSVVLTEDRSKLQLFFGKEFLVESSIELESNSASFIDVSIMQNIVLVRLKGKDVLYFTDKSGRDLSNNRFGNDCEILAAKSKDWLYKEYDVVVNPNNKPCFDLDKGYLKSKGSVPSLDLKTIIQKSRGVFGNSEFFGVVLSNTLRVSESGSYTFSTISDDGSTLRIKHPNGTYVSFTNQDGKTLDYLDNDYWQGATERKGTVYLEAGTLYTIEIRFWEYQGAEFLDAFVTYKNLRVNLNTSGYLQGFENNTAFSFNKAGIVTLNQDFDELGL